MKNLILLLLLFAPLRVYSEYNGVHISFDILYNDGSVSRGYKCLAHGENSEEFKAQLEEDPDVFLKNEYTSEPGEYGYYLRRLEYPYNNSILYRLIEPVEVRLIEIESIQIDELITASYAIGILGDFDFDDQEWMKTAPLIEYYEGEGMCTHDVFIHRSGTVPEEVIGKIQVIIRAIDRKLHAKERAIEGSVNSDEEFYEQLKDIYEERDRELAPFFEQNENLKTVVVSMCTC